MIYSHRLKISVTLGKETYFKMNANLHLQNIFNCLLSTLPSRNNLTYFSHNFGYILVKVNFLMPFFN